ncbi:MAG: alpha/beta hydrolase [Eubacteriales bacterium]|nr:alpha/beta hydrolase [Eubacteriales bacterium]MDD3882066.1 alpha/beta hydrolase [Eubacteriales bacterium]MDD4512513.1 alpha/beta hydrolase [Eubacteriales bacterium]
MSEYMNRYARPFFLKGEGETAVLLIHGFTGSPAHMLPIGQYLNSLGLTVNGICLTGHGKTPADMKKATCEDWLKDAFMAYDELAKSFAKVAVMGLSMGGCLSLCIAESRKPAAVVTFSAPMYAKTKAAYLAPVLKFFVPNIRPNPAKRGSGALMPEYDIGYPEYPTSAVAELSRVMKAARGGLGSIEAPVLSFQSDSDMAIDPRSADIIQNGVSSKEKRLVRLSGVPHVITISTELPKIQKETAEFLKKNDII